MSNAGERIRQCRLSCRMTQDEVAGYLGVAKQTVFKYENGIITNIPLEAIERMALLFRVPPAYLAGWKDILPQPLLLHEDEVQLIERYRNLPPEGQEMMQRQADAYQIMYNHPENPAPKTDEPDQNTSGSGNGI